MKRQNLILQLIFCLVFWSGFQLSGAYAQQADTEAEMLQELWGMAKKEIVSQYMEFSASESAAFWPVYEEYTAKRQVLANDRIKILGDYARNYTNLTDDKAAELTKVTLMNDIKLDKLQKKYYKKMKKAISPLRASQFLQLERYLNTAIRSELQEVIPFIGELEEVRQ